MFLQKRQSVSLQGVDQMDQPTRLSMDEIEKYHGGQRGKRAGKYLRFYCPLHGGDNQRSLQVNPDNGHFRCFACSQWGYLDEYREQWIEQKRAEQEPQRRLSSPLRTTPIQNTTLTHNPLQAKPQEPREMDNLPDLQAVLPGSLGEEYLKRRGIPLKVALDYGIGYAADGKWPHLKNGKPVRQWKWGRLTFPHTNPQGQTVNLYGRAVGSNDKVPKQERHDHLPGPKGAFNARALNAETVFICEGAFDAISLICAGYQDSCAIFGVDGLRWEWVKSDRIVFCLDQDQAGQSKWRQMAFAGVLRGKKIFFLPADAYHGHKDLNELWVATGKIDIGDWTSAKHPELPATPPADDISPVQLTIDTAERPTIESLGVEVDIPWPEDDE